MIKGSPEAREFGARLRAEREAHGYTRLTWGKMLGHEGSLIKKRIQEHETGRAFMHPESLQKIDLWRRCGLPEDAPSPDLGLGRQKSREIAIKKLRKKLGSDWVENK